MNAQRAALTQDFIDWCTARGYQQPQLYAMRAAEWFMDRTGQHGEPENEFGSPDPNFGRS